MKWITGALKSKTFWFNAITGTLAVVNALNGIIPNEYAGAIVAVGNIALRFMTSKPLNEK